MVAEILCVGTELLLGDIVNTNAAYLARQLAGLGIDLYTQSVVGDNPERLKESLAIAFSRADLVLTKPGGITLFETIFSELPILAWEPFLEQEKNNARFLVKRGLGRVAAKEPEECLSAIRALIYDDETLEWMAGNMRAMKGQLEEESLNRMLAGLEAEKGVRVG